jgi:hypothetical protein
MLMARSTCGRYHTGFREQVATWPVNPVDVVIRRLAELEAAVTAKRSAKAVAKAQAHGSKAGAARPPSASGLDYVVADFGCGDAAIAQTPALRGVVHSFDLVARNDWVTSGDMAATPLPDGCCHAAVFSLSLMGTNAMDYLIEAHRVLRPYPSARLLVAEVHSRIDDFTEFERQVGYPRPPRCVGSPSPEPCID